MPSSAKTFDLRPDEFAFYFSTERGIEAGDLGTFLKRASTVARRAGAEIRVVGLEHGSLAVILKAIAKNAANEYMEKPIDGTLKIGGAVAATVAATVGALVWASQPHHGEVTPFAKAGADVVYNQKVEKIEIITHYETVVVMDEPAAYRIREEQRRPKKPRYESLPSPEIAEMIEDMRDRYIEGSTYLIDDVLHFRPEGFQFYVPIDKHRSPVFDLEPNAYYRVSGELLTKRGQPDSMVIDQATRF